ncbi:MAG: ribosome maturation factor RimM [Bacteroidota bacterium]
MNVEACIELGTIQRKQGLRGEVVARLHDDVPPLDGLKTLFIQIDHTLVPYRLEKIAYQPRKAIIKLQGVNDPTTAHNLKGRAIFVPQESLPRLSATKMLLDRLIGYEVEDVAVGRLGEVQAIYTPPMQQLLVVAHQESELLIPYHEDIVTHVDRSQQRITVQLPKGFIEL